MDLTGRMDLTDPTDRMNLTGPMNLTGRMDLMNWMGRSAMRHRMGSRGTNFLKRRAIPTAMLTQH